MESQVPWTMCLSRELPSSGAQPVGTRTRCLGMDPSLATHWSMTVDPTMYYLHHLKNLNNYDTYFIE